jgi:hypothetical protein
MGEEEERNDEIRKILFDVIPDLPLLGLMSRFSVDHDGDPILLIWVVVDDSFKMDWAKYFVIKRKLRKWLAGKAFPVLTFYLEREASKNCDWFGPSNG